MLLVAKYILGESWAALQRGRCDAVCRLLACFVKGIAHVQSWFSVLESVGTQEAAGEH